MKIPSSEKIAVNYMFEGVKEYVSTYSTLKDKYMLYKIIDGDYQKLKTANTPIDFDDIVKKDRSE